MTKEPSAKAYRPLDRTKTRNITILLGSTLVVMAGTAITPALPEIAATFQDVPNAEFLVRLSLTMPSLTIAASALFVGLLLDHWGRRPVLLVSSVLYTIAGASGFVVDSLFGLLIGRAILGLAVAGVMSGFTTLIADYFQGPDLNRFMGYQGAAIGAGGMVYLTLGGFLADIGWRYPFLLHFFALLIIPAVLFSIREPETVAESERAETVEVNNHVVSRTFAVIYGVAFAGMLIFFVFPTQLPFYLVDEAGASNSQVGLALSLQTLTAVAGALLYQRLKSRLSHQSMVAIIFLTLGLNHVAISLEPGFGFVALALLIGGFGLGILPPTLGVWIASTAPQAIRGRAVGGLTAMLFLGQFVAPIVTQPVLNRFGVVGMFAIIGSSSLLLAGLFAVSRRHEYSG